MGTRSLSRRLRHVVLRTVMVSSLIGGTSPALLIRSSVQSSSDGDGRDVDRGRGAASSSNTLSALFGALATTIVVADSKGRSRRGWSVGVNRQPARMTDVSSILARRYRLFDVVRIAPITAAGPASALQAGRGVLRAPDVGVKAAFLYNFAKFTEWPALRQGAPIVACIVGDGGIAAALVEIAGVRTIDDHPLVIGRSQDSATWRACQILFIADTDIRRAVNGLTSITTEPVLTVSDSAGFAQAGGIIELYSDGGQMRFVINAEAAERSGLRLSSKLLSLAKVIRQTHAGR